MVVAPLADQLSVLLPPEVMVVGLAANDVIEGAEALAPVEPVPVEPVVDPPEVDVPDPVLDAVDDPLLEVFVALLVRPQAPRPKQRPTQSSRTQISAPR
jgi:hypothetical protein